jgi:hypothetical protein
LDKFVVLLLAMAFYENSQSAILPTCVNKVRRDLHAPLMKFMPTRQSHHTTNTIHVFFQTDHALALFARGTAAPFCEAVVGGGGFFFFFFEKVIIGGGEKGVGGGGEEGRGGLWVVLGAGMGWTRSGDWLRGGVVLEKRGRGCW